MADLPPYPGAPRWVKVSGIIGIAVVLLFAIMMLIGGGNHGPSRHLPSSDAGSQTSPASVSDGKDGDGHTPPAGGHSSS